MSNEVEEPCVFLEARFKKKTLGIVVIIIVIMNMIFNYTVSTSLHVLLTCFFFLVILRRVITFIWLILAVLLSSVEQRSLAQYSTVLYNIIQYSTVKYNTL